MHSVAQAWLSAQSPSFHQILTTQKPHNSHKRDKNTDRRNDRNNKNNDRRSGGAKQDRPKREAIVDLQKYYGQKVLVKFIGGRYVVGVLKGFDQLMNLVLEDVVETLRDPEDDSILTENTRSLGKVVVRGPQLLTLAPLDGTEMIDNPFAAAQE